LQDALYIQMQYIKAKSIAMYRTTQYKKPTYQESLLWAGRLGARLKKLEKKDLPR